ncbi:hypothetical protein RI129_002657 [Pyrocoelia pectoralis]|uniref:DDE Tnp4 domain-containing protein n=1 Tax=Pyrocoelia pectoralis TaxID=417401 RepID=A0AAN7ZI31_9COLE
MNLITEKLISHLSFRFLVTGDSYRSIAFCFRLGETTVSNIVSEVCRALWLRLQPAFMPEPDENILLSSTEQFENKWQYPNCAGAIDGKHVVIQCPRNSGSNYFNYKKTFSIVLLALVDANYKFIAIDVGAYGRNSDSSILLHSKMGKKLEAGDFGMPPDKVLPGTNISMPCVILGDEAFTLSSYMMRPYPRAFAREEHKLIYNYRHCRARRVSENAFGIMAQKFRVYRRPLEMHVDTVIRIVKATCILHNFMRCKTMIGSGGITDEEEASLIESGALDDIQPTNRRGRVAAYEIRNKFANYFNSPNGSVPWQSQRIHRLE